MRAIWTETILKQLDYDTDKMSKRGRKAINWYINDKLEIHKQEVTDMAIALIVKINLKGV